MTKAEIHTHDTRNSEAERKAEDALALRIILVVVLALLAWAGAVALWGLPGLYLPAVALVPVIWILLLLISFG